MTTPTTDTDQLTITVSNGQVLDGGVRRFSPGQMVEGQVTLNPSGDIRARSVVVWLAWYTTGRGDRDQKIFEETTLHEGSLSRDTPNIWSFNLRLPDQPWSYSGHYINIVWAVQAKIDVPWASDIRAEQRFIMRPAQSADGDSSDAAEGDPFGYDPFAKDDFDPFGGDPFAEPGGG